MNKKPLVLRLFIFFLLLEPLIKIFILHSNTEFPFWVIINRSTQLDWLNLLNFWFLFPVSGIVLIKLNPKNFIIFLFLQIYSLLFHLFYESYTWPYLSKLPHLSSIIFLSLNLLITLYVLLPRTRQLFFNANLRWWERASRFKPNCPIIIISSGLKYDGIIKDISKSGARIAGLPKKLELGEKLHISFELANQLFILNAIVVRQIPNKNNEIDLGVNFLFSNILTYIKLRLLFFKIEVFELLPKYR